MSRKTPLLFCFIRTEIPYPCIGSSASVFRMSTSRVPWTRSVCFSGIKSLYPWLPRGAYTSHPDCQEDGLQPLNNVDITSCACGCVGGYRSAVVMPIGQRTSRDGRGRKFEDKFMSETATTLRVHKHSAPGATLRGGSPCVLLDITAAFVVYSRFFAVHPSPILQGIASGMITLITQSGEGFACKLAADFPALGALQKPNRATLVVDRTSAI